MVRRGVVPADEEDRRGQFAERDYVRVFAGVLGR